MTHTYTQSIQTSQAIVGSTKALNFVGLHLKLVVVGEFFILLDFALGIHQYLGFLIELTYRGGTIGLYMCELDDTSQL